MKPKSLAQIEPNYPVELPELKSGLAYVFALHNEVFRYITNFGEVFGKSLCLIKDPKSLETNFDWIVEIANSSFIKGERRNFLNSINSELSIELIEKFNEYTEAEDLEIKFNILEESPEEKAKAESVKSANHFEEFNQLTERKIFDSKAILLTEGVNTFAKERISLWFQNWSQASKITKKIIKKNIENSSDLLNTVKDVLKTLDDEPWRIADSLIWFGDETFTENEINSIQENIFNHIQFLIYREKTVGDKYNWFSEEKPEYTADISLFKLIIWLMNYPEEYIRRRSKHVIRHLINSNPNQLLQSLFEEAINNESIELRLIIFNMMLEFAKQEPELLNSILIESNPNINQIINDSDLVSIKFLKEIGKVLNNFGFEKLIEAIKKKYMVPIKEFGDVFFEDERFACVDHKIEQLNENNLLSPDTCKALDRSKESYLSPERIEILKKSNHYLRQSFRESRHLGDNYRNAVKNCLNRAIINDLNIERIDLSYEIINN